MIAFVIVAHILLTDGQAIGGQFDQAYPTMDACRAAIPAAQAALEKMLEMNGAKAAKIDIDCAPASPPGQGG